MRRSLLLGFLALPVLAGCSSNPAPVPVSGELTELQRMAGEWAGEYESPTTGRSGSILFRIQAGRDTAFGDVIMTPAGSNQAYSPADRRSGRPPEEPPSARVLNIHFVEVSGGGVRGRMEPYWVPDCSCVLTTTFIGTVDGDTVRGTYRSLGEGLTRPQAGTWYVIRRAGSGDSARAVSPGPSS